MYPSPDSPYRLCITNICCREVLLGITGNDFVLLGASNAAMRGVTILKAEDDKTRTLNPHTLMAFSGEAGDTGMFYRWKSGHKSWIVWWDELMDADVCVNSSVCGIHSSQCTVVWDEE